MTGLSNEQEALRASIKKGAIIWGVVLGVIVAGLAYWILGSQTQMIRAGAAIVAGLAVAGTMYRKSMSSGAAGAKCAKCNATFSIARSDRAETLVSSEPKEEREKQDDGSTKITTWTSEVYDVVDTYSCSSCGNTTQKEYRTTRKRDEEVVVKSAVKKAKEPAKQGKPAPVSTKGKNSKG